MKSYNQHSFHSSPSQSEANSRLHLPKIDGRLSTEDNEYYENPFYVPPDEEIFKLKNKEKELKEEERKKNQSLKIWEKGIKHGSAGQLRKIMELTNLEEDDQQDEKDGKLNIVEAAKSAIKNRVRHKEPLLNFLNKKREMFLFQMSINEKKEQIKEFEELAHLQEISLQNSKDLLEKDAETFKQHVEKNKNETRQAIKNAEDETKEKQKKIQKMKQLQEDLSTVMSKNTKQLEKLEKLYNYKKFLDELTPEEFLRMQRKSKEEKKGVYKSMNATDKKEQAKEDFKWQIYNINLSEGIMELLNNDNDEFEMYFKRPDQLQEFFENLEEKNLFIIKHTQDIEQSLEDLKHNFEIKKADLLGRERLLRKNKQDLEKTIQARSKTRNQLYHVKDDVFTENTLNKLESNLRKIYEEIKILKEGKGDQQISGLEVLKLMERKLDQQMKELKQFYPQKVYEQHKVCKNKRSELKREQDNKKLAEDLLAKVENNKKRLMVQKRFGRPIMAKSMVKKENQEKRQEDEEDIEEIERKKFFTIRFQ